MKASLLLSGAVACSLLLLGAGCATSSHEHQAAHVVRQPIAEPPDDPKPSSDDRIFNPITGDFERQPPFGPRQNLAQY